MTLQLFFVENSILFPLHLRPITRYVFFEPVFEFSGFGVNFKVLDFSAKKISAKVRTEKMM